MIFSNTKKKFCWSRNTSFDPFGTPYIRTLLLSTQCSRRTKYCWNG